MLFTSCSTSDIFVIFTSLKKNLQMSICIFTSRDLCLLAPIELPLIGST